MWVGYFALDQLFELPGMIVTFIALLNQADGVGVFGDLVWVLRILSTVGIIAIGCLLLEYISHGTIYNQAFNIVCISTVMMLFAIVTITLYGLFIGEYVGVFLDTFNNLYRIAMVFLSAFFAYDAAKMQLKKVKISK